MQPAYWGQACGDLAGRDPVLGQLIRNYAGMALVSRRDPFLTLVRSVIGQQISVTVADSLWHRLQQRCPCITPAPLLCLPLEDLQACGLSRRKAEYLHDLARHFQSGQSDIKRWPQMSDAELIADLTKIRGIGVWTAEMFLIFNQLRPDVLPLDDIGLQKAVARWYFDGQRPGRAQLARHAEPWRPWRSVATWYLWRSLDPVPVAY